MAIHGDSSRLLASLGSANYWVLVFEPTNVVSIIAQPINVLYKPINRMKTWAIYGEAGHSLTTQTVGR
ncbi:hypothetical protein L484_017743 [Morus notabilis]|uniref:Uncharacterized protein n=1 Tax=Morus notabilis TaxID=981085 RepID=W9R345_9ROSA|nr:hypothetical protein L484_017743 [Morus notabilis]